MLGLPAKQGRPPPQLKLDELGLFNFGTPSIASQLRGGVEPLTLPGLEREVFRIGAGGLCLGKSGRESKLR